MTTRHTCMMIALCGLMAACASRSQEADAGAENSKAAVADSAAVSEKTDTAAVDAVTSATNVANSPTFNGLLMVAPDRMATVSTTMGGRIHSLRAMPGRAVARGEVVATLDDPAFVELQQTYLEAAAQLEYLEAEYRRQQALGTHVAASQHTVQQSKAEYLAMKSRAEAAATRLHALGVSPQSVREGGIKPYLPIKAPIGGHITRLEANLGKYIEAGSSICDIVDQRQPLVQLTVYEKDIHLMQVGGKVGFRVNGMGKKTFRAVIVSIDQSVDKSDYSVKVYARVEGGHPTFRPGMYVRAKLIQNSESTSLIHNS
ncbi:MAG: efflux RND transporter periplasmic adaptor subunit [Bacteroidales bacterium]|nr:efflux RND transporter periplasmic adaptor subunit [Bacteroidales bacterium]MDD6746318.1 efflux RND transporter periplasmic adaptor subunit [Bacteroidales bacterium]